ncbi:hypothetical protein [Leptolyngbya sp. 7M]|uniref:hypothetical protein n=1 Tax=Leptolyngbya sp. 7M TaxID=2812896 RepID=UPI001B8D30F5|nr:hypothetical protein [Leptolyngbya sp. 7M]QYO67003.1 hypothetical protein JVX88_09435 [Leptolyngbya sp. 7M]
MPTKQASISSSLIEWSDEPSVFAANALSPAKVSQVRITDIENREMDVIVGEDQLSLAIGKKGQNVRLATRLVGWNINIVSEDLLKKEIAQQMGRMMASGEAVPITALEGVTSNQAEILAEKGITDVESLAAATLDDLVDYLDLTYDEAQSMISSAAAIVEAKNAETGLAEIETNEDVVPDGESVLEHSVGSEEVADEFAETEFSAEQASIDDEQQVAGETNRKDAQETVSDEVAENLEGSVGNEAESSENEPVDPEVSADDKNE